MSKIDLSIVERRTAKRRKKQPAYAIEARISGRYESDGCVRWDIEIDGEGDCIVAAGILERAAEVLRDED